VMYLDGSSDCSARRAYTKPLHPYTEGHCCRRCRFPIRRSKRKRIMLQGTCRARIRPPTGCRFHNAVQIRQLPLCSNETPELKQSSSGHWVAVSSGASRYRPAARTGTSCARWLVTLDTAAFGRTWGCRRSPSDARADQILDSRAAWPSAARQNLAGSRALGSRQRCTATAPSI